MPKCIPKFFLALGPKPSLLILPIRESCAIRECKPELTENEIDNQYLRISSEFNSKSYFEAIDAKDGVTHVIDEIVKLLQKH